MFGKSIRLPFKVLGIPLLLDISFLIILPVMSWMIARSLPQSLAMLHMDAPHLLAGPIPYLLGLAAAVGLFCSVLIHELGHASVARSLYGVHTESITLWLLGGLAALDTIPRQRYAEAVIAVAGPLTSFILAALVALPYYLMPHDAFPAVRFLSAYLALTNLMLGIFNLLPALPMDGGRVLRSLLATRYAYARATNYAATVSKLLAVMMGLFAVLSGNLFLVLLAFFVYLAGNAESRQTTLEELLHGIPVRTLMTRDVDTVAPDLPLAELPQLMFRCHHLGFPVLDPATSLPIGLITLRNVDGAAPNATVRDVMLPDPPTLSVDADASDAFRLLTDPNAPQRLLIIDPATNRLAGILTKTDLMHALKIRAVQADADTARAAATQGRIAWGQ